MNQIRYGRVVYPRKFAETVPIPASWDERPLPHLLRGQHRDPMQEIERIERWYLELKGSRRGLLGRLRSCEPRGFWAGLSELMTFRIFAERGWSSQYEPRLDGKTPDFLVQSPNSSRFVAEVLTAFQDPQEEKGEAAIYNVASVLNQICHRSSVMLEEVTLPERAFSFEPLSLEPLLPRVRAWLDQCKPGRSHKTTISLPEIGISLKLSTFKNPLPVPAPIVQGVMGLGGKITSTDRIQNAIQKKVDTYGYVASLDLPLVLFLWQGHWFKVTYTSLEWALFGRLQVHFPRDHSSTPAVWSHAPGGLFTFGENGLPRNTNLSAVAYCSRVWHRRRVYARVQIYHHPYADQRLPLPLFRGTPQYVPCDVTQDKFSCRWDRSHRKRGILLH